MTLPEAYQYALAGALSTFAGAWAMHLFVSRPMMARWKRQAAERERLASLAALKAQLDLACERRASGRAKRSEAANKGVATKARKRAAHVLDDQFVSSALELH